MSSTTPMFLRSLNKYLMADTKSGESSVRLSSGVSSPILMLNFRRPTRLKSYLRGSKNMPRKKVGAVSTRRGIARAQLAVDFDERLFRRANRILVQRAREHHADVVALREEHVDFGDFGFGKGLPDLGGERLVGLQQHFAGLAVNHVGDAVGAFEVRERR